MSRCIRKSGPCPAIHASNATPIPNPSQLRPPRAAIIAAHATHAPVSTVISNATDADAVSGRPSMSWCTMYVAGPFMSHMSAYGVSPAPTRQAMKCIRGKSCRKGVRAITSHAATHSTASNSHGARGPAHAATPAPPPATCPTAAVPATFPSRKRGAASAAQSGHVSHTGITIRLKSTRPAFSASRGFS